MNSTSPVKSTNMGTERDPLANLAAVEDNLPTASTPVTELTHAATLAELRFLLAADLFRYKGARGLTGGLRTYWYRLGFRVTFWMRLAAYLRRKPLLRLLYWLAECIRARAAIKYGISIPHEVAVGPGLYIGHYGGIVVNDDVRIGRNCNLSHGVTLGQTNRGARRGCPIIGDSVYIAPGAKVVGSVRIGSNAVIGANCVVVNDVGQNEVVACSPARVLSARGSAGYVNWTSDEQWPTN